MATKHPLKLTFVARVPARAADASGSVAVAESPFAGTVVSARYVPDAAINGANTNTRRISFTNRATNGAGTKEPAAIQFNSGTNVAAFNDRALTLSGTASNLTVAAGEVFSFDSTAVGTGIADPGGLVILEIERAA